VTLVALDGMKLGEVLAIDVDDVRLAAQSASVVLRRGGRRQEVPVTARTSQALAAYIADRRSGPLFLGDSAVAHEPARLTRFGADFIIKRAASVAGIDKPVSATLLRRSLLRQQEEGGDGNL
jgi:site-specific recombinase XerD